jgi:aminomuconate-semialdehyde/2-hydroxymuconate-6-semialdehyde dehydrogenase
MGHLDLARSEGARILCGGDAIVPQGRCANGWFITPTFIEDLGPATRCNTEEIFGPLVARE